MMRLSTFAIAVVACTAEDGASAEVGARKPIITSALLSDTMDLLSEVSDTAYNAILAGPVAQHSPKVTEALDQALETACSKMGKKKSEVLSKVDEVKATVTQVKADVTVKLAAVHEKLNVQTAALAAKFDKAMPKYAGAIPNTVGDMAVFATYVLFVLYAVFLVFRFFMRIVCFFFCCFCCCGCCRSRNKAAAVTPTAAKGKAAAKATGKKAAGKK